MIINGFMINLTLVCAIGFDFFDFFDFWFSSTIALCEELYSCKNRHFVSVACGSHCVV